MDGREGGRWEGWDDGKKKWKEMKTEKKAWSLKRLENSKKIMSNPGHTTQTDGREEREERREKRERETNAPFPTRTQTHTYTHIPFKKTHNVSQWKHTNTTTKESTLGGTGQYRRMKLSGAHTKTSVLLVSRG